jgi:hypothetical protein
LANIAIRIFLSVFLPTTVNENLIDFAVQREAEVFLQEGTDFALEGRAGDVGAVSERITDDYILYATDFNSSLRAAYVQTGNGLNVKPQENTAFELDGFIRHSSPPLGLLSAISFVVSQDSLKEFHEPLEVVVLSVTYRSKGKSF